ncbi:MarR family transcriptional regulator [Pseudonocardia humida]|uniref:MarR family transcriptional regulator n=1 Tax=Pseudonocardia humida TaxID=2800819 RepID=A0ABT1A2Q6_9PSEU|nr:MarR family transcriptional regulator [Pseudonocardia humida]MCO1657267.1 MarR family transcriptional regulator [Pseudonocardia humida]
MSSVSSGRDDARRAPAAAVRDGLRAANAQLSVLDQVVSARLDMRNSDRVCLDLIARHGPIGPSELARLAGVHPATMTGVIDRLQRAGWVVRERDPEAADRRGVAVRVRRDRAGEVHRLYGGMRSALDEICAGYSAAELELIVDFLGKVSAAGQAAAQELADQ